MDDHVICEEERRAYTLPYYVGDEQAALHLPTSEVAVELLTNAIFPESPSDTRYVQYLLRHKKHHTFAHNHILAIINNLSPFRRFNYCPAAPVPQEFGYFNYDIVIPWRQHRFPNVMRCISVDCNCKVYQVYVSFDLHSSIRGVEYFIRLSKDSTGKVWLELDYTKLTPRQFIRGLYDMIGSQAFIGYYDDIVPRRCGSYCADYKNQLCLLGGTERVVCGAVNHKPTLIGLVTILSALIKYITDDLNDILYWRHRIYID